MIEKHIVCDQCSAPRGDPPDAGWITIDAEGRLRLGVCTERVMVRTEAMMDEGVSSMDFCSADCLTKFIDEMRREKE